MCEWIKAQSLGKEARRWPTSAACSILVLERALRIHLQETAIPTSSHHGQWRSCQIWRLTKIKRLESNMTVGNTCWHCWMKNCNTQRCRFLWHSAPWCGAMQAMAESSECECSGWFDTVFPVGMRSIHHDQRQNSAIFWNSESKVLRFGIGSTVDHRLHASSCRLHLTDGNWVASLLRLVS